MTNVDKFKKDVPGLLQSIRTCVDQGFQGNLNFICFIYPLEEATCLSW